MIAQSVIPIPALVSSASYTVSCVSVSLNERATLAFHELWLKGKKSLYTDSPDFLTGWRDGMAFEEGYADGFEGGFSYTSVVESIEQQVSRKQWKADTERLEAEGMLGYSYVYSVGFAYGWLFSLFVHDAAPSVPLGVLAPWYTLHQQVYAVAERLAVRRV